MFRKRKIPTGSRETTKRYCTSLMEVFGRLDEEAMAELEQSAPMQQVGKGHLFFIPGQQVEHVYFIRGGKVRLFRVSPDGRVLTVALLGPGDMFGKMSFFALDPEGTGAETMDPTTVCTMTKEMARDFILRHPQAGLRLLGLLEQRLNDMEARLESLSFKKLPFRLAALLLQLDQGCENIVRSYTHQDIADILGAYRETVTKTLNEWRLSGWIELGRKQIVILERRALQEMAELP